MVIMVQDDFFDKKVKEYIGVISEKLNEKVILELHLDDREVSKELVEYMENLVNLMRKVELTRKTEASDKNLPYVKILDSKGQWSSISFHGVPGGHEFTPFLFGICNTSGKFFSLSKDEENRIKNLRNKVNLTIFVSLTCSFCPELVSAAMTIAVLNRNVKVNIYDLNHFEKLRVEYKVMSVPCFVIEKNGEKQILFGKKNVSQLLSLIE